MRQTRLPAKSFVVAGAGLMVLLAACSSNASNKSNGAAAPTQAGSQPLAATVAPTAAASTSLITVTPRPATSGSPATPATNPLARISGTVASVNGNAITLTDGTSFNVSPQTAVTVNRSVPASTLAPGQIVAITAKRQPDNTLLASLVRIFPTAPGGSAFFRQFPLESGDLMTNATIDKVQGNSFSASFPGGSAQVTLAPDAQVQMLASGTLADVKPGAMISAGVANGTAQSVSVQ